MASALTVGSRPRGAGRSLPWLPSAAVVVLQVAYPLVHGEARDRLTIATVVVFATASVVHAAVTRGARYTVALVTAACGIGLLAEVVGVRTGIPFGDYRYTGGLGVTLAGVPLTVVLAWLMMTHPSAVVAAQLSRSAPARVVVGAVALTTWDVYLDPQMVAAGHWTWRHPSPHLPGIDDVPLSNFGGWLLVSLVVMGLLLLLAGRERQHRPRGGRPATDAPATALWGWTWLASGLANVAFFGRPAVAAWGLLAMGIAGVPLMRLVLRGPVPT